MEALPAPPAINLQSPRVRAAMRVMGIIPADLEKKEIDEYEGNKNKHLLFEKKRRTLIEQVALLASRGPQEKGGPGAGDMNANFLEEIYRREKKTMETMARMGQKDIQKTVIKELESRLNFEKGKKKQEENLKRMLQLKKERDDWLKEQQKKADKKREQTREVVERNDRQLQARCEELRQQLKEADDRVAKCIADIRQAHDDQIEGNQVRGIEARKQKANFEQMLVEKREEMHDAIEEKHARKRELLSDLLSQRVSNKEKLQQEQLERQQRVAEYLANHQADIEDKYDQSKLKHKKAQDTREEKSLAKTQSFKTLNEKKRKAFAQRYENLIRDREREHEEFRRNWESRTLQKSASETLRPRERPELLRAREEAEHFAALAAENRERVRRAHANSVDQQIEHLLAVRQRAEALEDRKTKADKTRMVVMRNTAVAKHELKHKVDRFKDVGIEKMLDLLEDVELEPAARARINETLGELNLPPLGGYLEEQEK